MNSNMEFLAVLSTLLLLCLHSVSCRLIGPADPVLPDDVIEGNPRTTYGRRPILLPFGRSCDSSYDCRNPSNKRIPSCCRDTSGNLVDPDTGRNSDIFKGSARQGRCSLRRGGPGEECNDSCGCMKGYECYRTITGACCPTKTCWTNEAAEQDRIKWQNCRPPTCFFPA